MVWNFNPDDYDADILEGFPVLSPGRYHVQVISVVEESAKDGSMIVDFECLAGTTPGQEGRTHREYFHRSSASQSRALTFACAVKLTTQEEVKRLKEQGKGPDIDFNLAVGRQLCFEVKPAEAYKDAAGVTKIGSPKVGFAFYSTDSPRVLGIPLNQGMLAKRGDAAPNPFAGATDDNPF